MGRSDFAGTEEVKMAVLVLLILFFSSTASSATTTNTKTASLRPNTNESSPANPITNNNTVPIKPNNNTNPVKIDKNTNTAKIDKNSNPIKPNNITNLLKPDKTNNIKPNTKTPNTNTNDSYTTISDPNITSNTTIPSSPASCLAMSSSSSVALAFFGGIFTVVILEALAFALMRWYQMRKYSR